MAPKAKSSKEPKATNRVKMGSMLDVDGFLKQHGSSEAMKKIIQSFKDSGLLKYLTFENQTIRNEEVLELYLNAKVQGREIHSKVGGVEVRSHSFSEKEL